MRPSVGVESYRPERFRRGCDGDLVRRGDQHAILTLAEHIARSLAVVNTDFRARCTHIAVNRTDDRIVVRLIQLVCAVSSHTCTHEQNVSTPYTQMSISFTYLLTYLLSWLVTYLLIYLLT